MRLLAVVTKVLLTDFCIEAFFDKLIFNIKIFPKLENPHPGYYLYTGNKVIEALLQNQLKYKKSMDSGVIWSPYIPCYKTMKRIR